MTGPWDTATLTLALLLGLLYACGVVLVTRRSLPWPARPTLAWTAGICVLLVTALPPMNALAHRQLWVETVQILVQLLLAPVLLCYGRPLGLVADALPGQVAARVTTFARGRAAGLITSPMVGPILVPALLGGLYFTPLMALSLRHGWADGVLHAVLVTVGLAIGFGLVGDGTESESSLAIGVAVAVGFAELLLDAVPGIVLRLQTQLISPGYWAHVPREGGLGPLADQHRAGSLLWFVAEAADLPFLVILVRRWIRADEREAVRIDTELDLTGPVRGEQDNALDRPWWETDPSRLAGHRLGRKSEPGNAPEG